MVPLLEALPTLLASIAALATGLVSLAVGVSLGVFLTRAVSAFAVFWALGAVMRALMAEAARSADNGASHSAPTPAAIEPGTPVGQLLEEEHAQRQAHSA